MENNQTSPQAPKKKLVRSKTNKWLFGICGALAEEYGVDPLLVRLLFFFLGFWLYVALIFISVNPDAPAQ
ncbi:MAG: PspC domain-containing protein [Defluviitaleaceae bacterium]|nr:PspC domain-containing protein [Defluviitaleaceae bacterium]